MMYEKQQNAKLTRERNNVDFTGTDRVNSKHIRVSRINSRHRWVQLKMVILMQRFISEIKKKNTYQKGKEQATTLKSAGLQHTVRTAKVREDETWAEHTRKSRRC